MFVYEKHIAYKDHIFKFTRDRNGSRVNISKGKYSYGTFAPIKVKNYDRNDEIEPGTDIDNFNEGELDYLIREFNKYIRFQRKNKK